jgi:hypothetical protein
MEGENPGEDGRDYSKKEDKPDWRSKDAPEGEFDSLDPKPREFKPREFKPRSEYSERRSTRFDSKEGGNNENRQPRRERDSSDSEFKSREFKPREYKPRDESGDTVFIPREKREFNKDDRKTDRPARDDRYNKGERPEHRKVEKVKLKPTTRIEERDEYLHPKKIITDVNEEYPDFQNTPEVQIAPVVHADSTPEREPSKGNKFTEQRDYKIMRTRELRPRKAKPAESDQGETKAKTEPEVSKPKPKTPKAPINYDDLED